MVDIYMNIIFERSYIFNTKTPLSSEVQLHFQEVSTSMWQYVARTDYTMSNISWVMNNKIVKSTGFATTITQEFTRTWNAYIMADEA